MIFSDSDIDIYDYDMNSYHDSSIHPNWADKTIQAAGDLLGDPLDTRKSRSQFHNDFCTCDLNILERFCMMVLSDTYSY